MIRSFGDDLTRAIYEGEPVALLRRISPDLRERIRLKLDVLDSSISLIAVGALPGTRLESLRGDLSGFLSIRVNDQWRIVFRWTDGDVMDVRVIDYHR